MKLPLKLDFTIPQDPLVNYTDPVLLIGSCFAEEIGSYFAENLFKTVRNPFGVLYNPVSIRRALENILRLKSYDQSELHARQGLYHTWDHHGSFSGPEPGDVLMRINENIQTAHDSLMDPKLQLFITFGGMRVFMRDGSAVANCHKYPGEQFSRELPDIDVETSNWCKLIDELLTVNPGAGIWFTLSPVRHIRDGLVENQRSKALALELIHRLCERYVGCRYFPAYEIVLDELRDYRFYEQDMVHPNALAVEYIWWRLTETVMDDVSRRFLAEGKDLRNRLNHRVLHPGTDSHRKFEQQNTEAIHKFITKYGVEITAWNKSESNKG